MDALKKISDFFPEMDYELKIITNEQFTRTAEEILTPIETSWHAPIPQWLNGNLICNGPGRFTVGDNKLNHLYDGMALLQKFHLSSNGKVTYQSKFIQSEAHARGCKENRILFPEFGTKPTSNPSNGVLNKFLQMIKIEVTDNTVIIVNSINDEFYAMTDSSKINKIDIKTLDTVERIDMADKYKISGNACHVHMTMDKTVYSLGTTVTAGGTSYNIIAIPNAGKGVEKGKIVAKMHSTMRLNPSYMHSFGITKNFFIVIETPLKVSLTTYLKGTVLTNSFSDCLKWHEGEPTIIHLINRMTGKLQYTFYSEPFFFFHIANQYEKNDHVILDVVCYLNNDVADIYWFEKLAKDDPNRLKKSHSNVMRFVMPLKAKDKNVNLITLENTSASAWIIDDKVKCIPELICGFGCEFPRINYPKYSGVEYKFIYIHGRDGGVIKINVETKEKIFWVEEDIIIYDPLFIASPNARDEDDGIVLTGFFRNGTPNCTGLIIFNAKNLEEISRCEFENLPTAIPKPFHTTFIQDAE